jgi:hypothetical protein
MVWDPSERLSTFFPAALVPGGSPDGKCPVGMWTFLAVTQSEDEISTVIALVCSDGCATAPHRTGPQRQGNEATPCFSGHVLSRNWHDRVTICRSRQQREPRIETRRMSQTLLFRITGHRLSSRYRDMVMHSRVSVNNISSMISLDSCFV